MARSPTRDLKERVVKRFSKSPVALIVFRLSTLRLQHSGIGSRRDRRRYTCGREVHVAQLFAWSGQTAWGDIQSSGLRQQDFYCRTCNQTLSVLLNNFERKRLWRLARRSDRMALLHRRIDTVPFSHRNCTSRWAIWRILSLCPHLLGCSVPSDPWRGDQTKRSRVCYCCSGDGIWSTTNPISTYCTQHGSPLVDKLYPDLCRGD